MQKKNNSELFTTMSVGRAVAKLAIPTVISQIVVILYSLADTFFVGQIGDPNQLAALSITFPIFTLLTAVANLFGIGANSVISRSLGKNDKATAKEASSFGFWASIVVTAILAIILGVFMNPILTFFKADEFTLVFSAKYLFWVFVIGGIPTVAGLILGHLVRAVGKTKEASIGLSLGGILNIILDPSLYHCGCALHPLQKIYYERSKIHSCACSCKDFQKQSYRYKPKVWKRRQNHRQGGCRKARYSLL